VIEDQLVDVGIGEIKIGTGTDFLRATLGSCIGIAVLWKARDCFGLAHCLLPESASGDIGSNRHHRARFISDAVPLLLKTMSISPINYAEIDIHLVGGARMLSTQQSSSRIGMTNIRAAEHFLTLYGLSVTRKDIGGRHGRQITVDCSSGVVNITKIISPWRMHSDIY